jgi:hypothetical protein
MKDGEDFRISDSERGLLEGYANEQTKIGGVPVDYWCINAVDTVRDPLYAEPIERMFIGPFRLFAVFQAPQHTVSSTEEGLLDEFTSTCSIPRKAFEDAGAPLPGPGDVLNVWNLPIYTAISTVEALPLPGSGYYFDILQANPDGYIADSPTFVRWVLPLKRRTTFTPERRLVRP